METKYILKILNKSFNFAKLYWSHGRGIYLEHVKV